jgi:glycerol-3-phosphate O-acyltransferase
MGRLDETPWPGTGESVALLFADTPLEHDVLASYLDAVDGTVEAVAADQPDLGALLSGRRGDPEVVPLRVAWVERLGGVLKLAGPLAGRLQDRLLRRHPAGARVVAGEPARVGELRRRFEATTGGGDAAAFGSFVARQGTLALERAQRRLTGRPKVPRLVVEEIEASARFKEGIATLAATLGREPGAGDVPVAAAAVATEAGVALAEMAASQSPLALAAWHQLERVAARAYHIDVDTSGLERLRRLGRKGTLVFLPSHRSYMDPLVLRSALDDHGFPPNHVLGGINVAFWPVGPIGKRAGLVFIRRRVRDDPVYRFVLREYVSWLVRKRFNLEWYIEGGRTRTGKLRPPRLGLLAYLVEAFRCAGPPPGSGVSPESQDSPGEVHLVPVAIVYDQLYEVRTMAAEEHGAEKRPESFGWALGYARAQGRGLGAVHVRFGEPLALAEGLEASGGSVEKLAFEVCHRINRATPLTANALVSLALLGVDDRALTVDQTAAVLSPLLDYLERRGLEVAGDVDLGTREGVRATLDALTAHGVLRQASDFWSVARHLEAAFYRNAGIHFFVNRAIVEMVALRVADQQPKDPLESAWAEALHLRDLLKFEFFFARKRDFATELAGELDVFDSDWTTRGDDPGEVWEHLAGSGLFLAHRVLRSFLEAYLVVAERLAGSREVAAGDEEAFVSACVGVSRQWHLQGRLASPESASKELFGTGWRLAAHRGLLGDPTHDTSLAGRRAAFAAEVAEALARVERVREASTAALPAPGVRGVPGKAEPRP